MLAHNGNPDASASIDTSTFHISNNDDQIDVSNTLYELKTLKNTVGSNCMSSPVAESTVIGQRSMDISLQQEKYSTNSSLSEHTIEITTIERLRKDLESQLKRNAFGKL